VAEGYTLTTRFGSDVEKQRYAELLSEQPELIVQGEKYAV